jgi:hypothetical protein
MAQMSALSAKYRSVKVALRLGSGRASDEISRMEHVYDGCKPILSLLEWLLMISYIDPLTILRFPCLRQYSPDDAQRRRLAGYFTSQFESQGTFHEWYTLLPQYCTRYGKVRIRGDGDQIRSAVSGNTCSSAPKRDASFVRVSPYILY